MRSDRDAWDFCRIVIFCLGIGFVPTVFGQAALTPAQIAVLKRDLQKAEDQYVRQIARITSLRESEVRPLLPDRSRIADPVSRMLAALERALGAPLSSEQAEALRRAESDYQAARKSVESDAGKR